MNSPCSLLPQTHNGCWELSQGYGPAQTNRSRPEHLSLQYLCRLPLQAGQDTSFAEHTTFLRRKTTGLRAQEVQQTPTHIRYVVAHEPLCSSWMAPVVLIEAPGSEAREGTCSWELKRPNTLGANHTSGFSTSSHGTLSKSVTFSVRILLNPPCSIAAATKASQ